MVAFPHPLPPRPVLRVAVAAPSQQSGDGAFAALRLCPTQRGVPQSKRHMYPPPITVGFLPSAAPRVVGTLHLRGMQEQQLGR